MMIGKFSLYLKVRLIISIPPEILVSVSLFSDISGTAFSIGSAISKVGLIFAAVSAIPKRDINAPDTIPYAVLNAMYSAVETPVTIA